MVFVTRRGFLVGLAAGGAMGVVGGRVLLGQMKSGGHGAGSNLVDRRTNAAVRAGLGYLVARQNEDGCFGSSGYRRHVAVVSLAGMAFMASGSAPGRGPYGDNVNRCVRYLLNHCQDSGFIFAPDATSRGPMYGHGFATLFLAEAYGMWPTADLRDRLQRAVKLIIDTQNEEGGWRYQPERQDADISVTICQVMALRAARNAGLFVPNKTVDRCIDYVKQCQNADGGFSYMLPSGVSQFPRSAAGVVALYSAGIYEGDEVKRGIQYLMQFTPRPNAMSLESHFFYGHYYAVQAMWQTGGDRWKQWYPAIRETLLSMQKKKDGSWFDQICSEYGTAMACLILQMPNNYLPIFQR